MQAVHPHGWLPLQAATRVAVQRLRRPRTDGVDRDRVDAESTCPRTEVINSALRLLTVLADTSIAYSDGASISTGHNGRLATVASSNEMALRMDEPHQYERAWDPANADQARSLCSQIDSSIVESRWPALVRRATPEHFASILTVPLLFAGRRLGALNIYSRRVQAFGDHELDLAALIADQAAGLLAAARPSLTDQQLANHIRKIIAQAQRVLADPVVLSARPPPTACSATSSFCSSSAGSSGRQPSTTRATVSDPIPNVLT
jgi:GAF domain